MQEKCGVVGISLTGGSAARDCYYSLYALQHRGQESAGIVTHDGFQQHERVGMGLVGDVFSEDELAGLTGRAGIGHVRYPTAGSVAKSCAQPFTVSFKDGSLGLSHNGNLVNADALRADLEGKGHAFTSDGDTEVIAHELARNLLDADLIRSISRTMERLHGSYSLTILHDDTVLGLRDPRGNRPLCLGKLENGYALASESAAIDTLEGELIRDVRPGELIVLQPDGSGYESYRLADGDDPAHCFFEWVYFGRPDSLIDGRLVYQVRRQLGHRLWEEHGMPSDVVMPVPDSGRAFASGYAEAAGDGTEFAEGLMKNRYVGRTFIMPTQAEREKAVRMKLNPIRETVDGRSVTLIDDSIVRGTTSSQLVSLMREAGATEVHFRIGSPPIVAPCYMGIDMATREELVAADRAVAEVRDHIGADSLAYIDRAAIADVLGIAPEQLCTACVTGKYPYDIAGEDTDRTVKRPDISATPEDSPSS